MYKVKRFSISNKSKLGLAAASMPIIGAGLGYSVGYRGPSKKELESNKKSIELDKKRLSKAESNLQNLIKKGRKSLRPGTELYYAKERVDELNKSILTEQMNFNYLTSTKYKKDKALKAAGKGAAIGTTSGILTGALAKHA